MRLVRGWFDRIEGMSDKNVTELCSVIFALLPIPHIAKPVAEGGSAGDQK